MAVSKDIQDLINEGNNLKTAKTVSPDVEALLAEGRDYAMPGVKSLPQRVIEGVATGLGTPQGLINVVEGQPAYSGTRPQIASQVASDISGVASIPLMVGKTAIKTVSNVAAGAATGGAMGGGNVGEKIKGFSDSVYNFIQDTGFNLLPDNAKRSVFANLMIQIPAITASNIIEAGPSALGLMNYKNQPLSEQTIAAQKAGIPVTKSIEPTIYPADALKEFQISKEYPQTYAAFDKQKLDALRKNFEKQSPAVSQTAEQAGGSAKMEIINNYEKLGKQFEEAETAAISKGKITGKDVGKSAAYQVYKYLVDNGVKDVLEETWTGNEGIRDRNLAVLIKKSADKLSNAKSTSDLVNQKRQYWNDAETYLKDAPSSNRKQAREVYDLYNKAIADSIPEGKAKDDWVKANAEYTAFSSAVEEAFGKGKIDNVREINNADVFSKAVTGQGAKGAEAIKEIASPKALKDMAYQYLTYNPRTGSLLDVDTIKQRFEVFKNKGLDKAIFDSIDIKNIEQSIALGEYVENPLKPSSQVQKRGGSQTAIIQTLLRKIPGFGNIVGGILQEQGRKMAENFLATPPGDLSVTGGRVGYSADVGPLVPATLAAGRQENKADKIKKNLKILKGGK